MGLVKRAAQVPFKGDINLTLTNFKYALKVAVFTLVIFFYTGAVFLMGRATSKTFDQAKSIEVGLQKSAQSKIASPQAQDAVQSSRVLASYVKLCSNTALGFEVAYPKDWFTTYNDSASQCMYFAPYSFVLPQTVDKDITPIAINIIKTDEWENTVKFYENPNELFGVVDTKNLQINDRSTTKVQSVSTGSGSLPRGFARVVYLVFDSKTPAVISYNQLDAQDDVVVSQKLLEDIVGSLKFF